MKRSYVSMFVLMMSVLVQAADIQEVVSEVCTQQGDTQSNEKPICDSLNRFTVNCLKTTGGVTAGTFLTVVDGPVQFEPFTTGVLKSDVSGIISSINGTSGQILSVNPITSAPAWTTLTSSNSSVLITVSANFIDLQATGSGSGDVVGPSDSVQNAVVLFADTTGKVIQQSLTNASTHLPVTIDSATNMANINNLSITANFNIPITTNGGTAGVITIGDTETSLIQALGPLRGGLTPTCIFAGGNAGNLTAIGGDNAGFGAFALENINAGQDNSAVGFQALSNCIDGSNNIAIGSGAGRTIVSGSSGIYIGADAPSDESGVIRIGTGYHSALFIEAVNRVVSGTSPIVSRVVVTSFSSNQVGINSASPVCIDDSSNVSNVNALIFVGGDVSGDDTFGSINIPATAPTSGGFTPGVITQQNTFLLHSGSPDGTDIYVGQEAGNVPVSTGLQNAGVGVGSLGNINSGMNNSALGFQSLNNLVSGNNNSAVGSSSLLVLSSGTDNTAVGYQALLNSTGSNNIALGSGAGRTITSGNSCIYIGADAQASNESGIVRIGTYPTHSVCYISPTLNLENVPTSVETDFLVTIDNSGNVKETTTTLSDVIVSQLPALTGSVGVTTNPESVYVQNGYAYVVSANSSNSFKIVNVSNSASPIVVGTLTLGGVPVSVFVQGSYAYVANRGSNLLQVINVSNPALPTLAGSASTGFSPSSVYVQGSYAYIVNETSNTLQIFNVSNPATPTLVSSPTSTGNLPVSVFVQGSYAYVANSGSNTLEIFNVSNPATPTAIFTISTTGINPVSVYVQNGYAYVAEASGILEIFDVSVPTSTQSVSAKSLGGQPQSVYVQNTDAYVANGFGTLQVLDVSNPVSPVLFGSVTAGGDPTSVFVLGNYAYVTNFSLNTLQILNAFVGVYIQQLEVGGSLTTVAQATFENGFESTGPSMITVSGYVSSSSVPALILIGNSSNNVNATPLRLVNIPTSGAFTAIGVDGNGNVIFSPSSRRFKENIHDVGVAAEKVYALEPVTFDYRAEHGGAKNVFGLIAEDVEQHLPNIVVYGEDGKPYSVAYQMLIPLLVKEMQKHKQELTLLRDRVKALEHHV